MSKFVRWIISGYSLEPEVKMKAGIIELGRRKNDKLVNRYLKKYNSLLGIRDDYWESGRQCC